jgi:hypothetical protein
VDEQNRDEEPPEYRASTPTYQEEQEYEYQDDGAGAFMDEPIAPPARKSDLKSMDEEELPFD